MVAKRVIVAKNAFWLSVCRFAADFSSLILFAAISRDLGPIATGQYSYAFALAAFIAILAASGLDQYGVRQYARLDTEADRSAFWRGMLFVQVLQLVCGLALLLIAVAVLGGKSASPVVIMELSVFLVGWGLSRTLFVPATADQEMTRPALLELACRSAANLSALVLCLLGVKTLGVMLVGLPIAGVVLTGLAVRNAAAHGAPFKLVTSWSEIVSTMRNVVPFTACEALGQFYIRADLLLVVQLMGSATAGWYAADLKMVEVGVTPLILLGTAAYPMLSRTALRDEKGFLRLSEEFLRSVLFVSGWLAVGMYCLAPLLVPEVLGGKFEPAARLLPLFSLLAITKGLEIALYRVLYAAKKQNIYLATLTVGTVLIVALNWWLIPHFGAGGAIAAIVLSTSVVNLAAMLSLRSEIPLAVFVQTFGRLGLPLACTAIFVMLLRETGLNEWYIRAGGCLAYPILGIAFGLAPDPRHSLLFAKPARSM